MSTGPIQTVRRDDGHTYHTTGHTDVHRSKRTAERCKQTIDTNSPRRSTLHLTNNDNMQKQLVVDNPICRVMTLVKKIYIYIYIYIYILFFY